MPNTAHNSMEFNETTQNTEFSPEVFAGLGSPSKDDFIIYKK